MDKEEHDRDLIYELMNNREAMEEEIDTMGSVELRNIIERCLNRAEGDVY